MNDKSVSDYRDFLSRYAEITRRRRPGFSLGSWAKALGLKSTSSLTKVLNGEREAGPELLQKLVQYFKFSSEEENHFRNLVALSKMKGSSQLKRELATALIQKQANQKLDSRLIELDQYELLSSFVPLAVRELTRISKMHIQKIKAILPKIEEQVIQRSLHSLVRLGMVVRDKQGHFVAVEDHVRTDAEIPHEAIQEYHASGLSLAQEKLKELSVAEREFQSLVLMIHSKDLPRLKEKIRAFRDSFEAELPSKNVDQLFQLQIQFVPISEKFEEINIQPFKEKK